MNKNQLKNHWNGRCRGSVLSACLDAVIDRLKSVDWLKYVDTKQLLEQLVKWEKMLEKIYDVLDDADEIQTTSRSVEIWLKMI
ncbi:hypothetical protein M5689_022039 [Euphorbia peplus]|nr:hypothetical protein M5689_022039 [Euphorbia peplus]